MKKIGEILKKERETRGLSLHEIGMSLKINPKILKAIEEGDEKNLPAKTFLRGFIRSYAQYLRLDVEQILQLFQEEVGSTRPPEPKSETETTSSAATTTPAGTSASGSSSQESSPKATAKISQEKPLGRPTDESLNPKSSSRMMTIIGAIVLVLLIAFVAKMVEKYQKEAAHPEEPVATTTTLASAPVPAEAAGAMTSSEPVSSETAKTTEASAITTTSSTLHTTTTLPPTMTTLHAVAIAPTSTTTTSTTMKPTTTTTTVTVTTTTTAVKTTTTTTTTTTLPGKKVVEVIVEALNTVNIKYALGDNPAQTLDMAADQVHTFKGRGKITLEVSDGGAISVIVNGRDRGVPGTIRQPIKLTYH
jgi:cytoskeleton protein RodZ